MKKNNLKPKNLWKKIPALPAGRRNPKHLSLRRSKATEAISAMLPDCFASLAMTKGRAGMTKVPELGISNLGIKYLRRFNTMFNIIKKKSLKTIHLPAKEKAALNYFKKELLKRLGGEVIEIRLFGSKARGDWRKYSDTDVLVALRSGSRKSQSIVMDVATEILIKFRVNISPHIYSQRRLRYLEGIPTVFFQVIKSDAIKL